MHETDQTDLDPDDDCDRDFPFVYPSCRYQRTCSVYQSRCLKPEAKTGANVAPVHVVMGHAGAGLCTNIESKRPPFFESVEVEHGYVVPTNARH